jgi:hypothetical protein
MYDGNIYVNTLDKTMKSLKLKPERKNAWEVGLDLRLFDSRLNFDFTYYKENTRDQIMYLSGSGKLAIKKGDWKYIDCLGSGGFTAPARLSPVKNGPKGQLYNMRTDSLESNNLFLREKGIANELSALLKKLLDQGYSRPQ